MNAEIPLTRSAARVPCIWEEGGALRNKGFARLVGGRHGGRLKPIFIRYNAQVPNADHALFRVTKGMIVVEARWSLYDQNPFPTVEVFRIWDIRELAAVCSLIGYHDGQKWRIQTPPGTVWLGGIIGAARRKCKMECCRVPLWYDDRADSVLQNRRSKHV